MRTPTSVFHPDNMTNFSFSFRGEIDYLDPLLVGVFTSITIWLFSYFVSHLSYGWGDQGFDPILFQDSFPLTQESPGNEPFSLSAQKGFFLRKLFFSTQVDSQFGGSYPQGYIPFYGAGIPSPYGGTGGIFLPSCSFCRSPPSGPGPSLISIIPHLIDQVLRALSFKISLELLSP